MKRKETLECVKTALKRIDVDYLIDNTSVFHDDIAPTVKLDDVTKKKIIRSLRIYLDSWVIPELEKAVYNLESK